MIAANVLIGFSALGESRLPPYFWERAFLGTMGVIACARLLDRLLRRRARRGPGPRRLRRLPRRFAQQPVEDRPVPPQAPELTL
jgi:hypothetical protein